MLHVELHLLACGAEVVLAAHIMSDELAQQSRPRGLSHVSVCVASSCVVLILSVVSCLAEMLISSNLEQLGTCPKQLESFGLVAVL